MATEQKRILVCVESLYKIGRMTTWLHDRGYRHTMATDLARAQYQIGGDIKFDLVVSDLPGKDAEQWLATLEGGGQLVLYLSHYPVDGRHHVVKPRTHFEGLKQPFLKKVAELLQEK